MDNSAKFIFKLNLGPHERRRQAADVKKSPKILKRAFKCITTDEETFNLASKRMKFSDSSLEDDDTTVLTGRVAIDIEVAMEDDLCISSWAWQKELKESVADILKVRIIMLSSHKILSISLLT